MSDLTIGQLAAVVGWWGVVLYFVGAVTVYLWFIRASCWLLDRQPFRVGTITGNPTFGLTFGPRPVLLLWRRSLYVARTTPLPEEHDDGQKLD